MEPALIKEIAGHLHAGQLFEAARLVLKFSGVKKDPKSKTDALEPINALLYWLLNEDRYEDAATLLWPESKFTSEPNCTQMVWGNLRDYALVLLQGASSMSKTYGAGVFYFLDWVRDPAFTTVKVLGPSEDHLQANLFSHLVDLHRTSAIPLPGVIGDLFIGLDPRNRRGSISGVVVPLGRRGAGRLQGIKRFPRPQDHPKFGRLSRLRILLDEVEKIPVGIWSDVDNVVSNLDGVTGLKVAGAYNPEVTGSPVYLRAEPPGGWETFDLEKDQEWTSKRGWRVVRLDGEKCENVIEGRVRFPGLQTAEGLKALAESSGGYQSPGYYTFGRAAYPPQGVSFTVIPGTLLPDLKARYLWYDRPRRCMAVDSALEGSDPAVVAAGTFGLAVGVEFPPSVASPAGRTIMFRGANDEVRPRHALQLDQLFALEKGDTMSVVMQIKRFGLELGVDPSWTMIDRTGNGSGVHDVLCTLWAPEVRGVNYSESSTHSKILAEDQRFCDEELERVFSELWFALRAWIETGSLKVGFAVDTEKLYKQMTTRLYRPGKRKQVESKRDYKGRGFPSPNEADALTLLLHCVRLNSGAQPSFIPELMGLTIAEEDGGEDYVRISSTELANSLDREYSALDYSGDHMD